MNYNNIVFAFDMKDEFGKYTNLAYSIEEEGGKVNLSICSTSMSELDGSNEGQLGSYTYSDKQEALDDIRQASRQYSVGFECIDAD